MDKKKYYSYLRRISTRFSPDKESEFATRSAHKIFLKPIGLSPQTHPNGYGKDCSRLSCSEEEQMFQALHYPKFKIFRAFENKRADYVDKWAIYYFAVRNRIASANVLLVHKIVTQKSHRGFDPDAIYGPCFMKLLDSVDGFDPWRGFKFSTYAWNAMARIIVHNARKRTLDIDEGIDLAHSLTPRHKPAIDPVTELMIDRLEQIIRSNKADMTDRELDVITQRFGLGLDRFERIPFHVIAEQRNVSKERIRQIEAAAIQKLRKALDEELVLQ